MIARLSAIFVSLLASVSALFAEPTSVELILDCSGSMWNKLADGRYRIDAAKEVLSEFIATAPEQEDLHIGLRLYGSKVSHRERGSCEDSVLVVPIEGFQRTEMLRMVKTARAIGATPLALSLNAATEDFSRSGKRQIIVFTDGEESCGGDVAAALVKLRADGFDADVRIIGIGLPKSVAERFATLAPVENADSALKLAAALKNATAMTVSVPATPVVMKEKVTVRVTKNGNPLTDGEVTFLGMGDAVVKLTKSEAPGEWSTEVVAGLYSASVAPSGRIFPNLAVARGAENLFLLDVTELPKVTLDIPNETIAVMSEFTALFSGANGTEDQIVIIAPVGAPDAAEPYYNWAKGKEGRVTLRAPELPGMYEARFAVRGADYQPVICGRSKPFEVKLPEILLDMPASVSASLTFKIKVKAQVQVGDWVGWVKAGAEDGDYGIYIRPSNETDTFEIKAPAEPGAYEMRYGKDGARQVFARKSFTVEGSALALEAPVEAMAGTKVKIAWQGPKVNSLYITIVAQGIDVGAYNDYERLGESENPMLLQSPRKAGAMEIRIMDEQENKLLFSRPITLTEMKASVEGPAEVPAGESIPVKWSGPKGGGDYVTIVKVGAANSDYLDYVTITLEEENIKITAPDVEGDYELRYVTRDSQVLARQPIRVK